MSAYDIVTFDKSLGQPPAGVMSTNVPPAYDMSITAAPAGVVLVYKPRSRKRLSLMKPVCGVRDEAH